MNAETLKHIIPAIQRYLGTQPVTRAWLFGSFARGEETATSDIDLLVDFDREAHVGLFAYARLYGGLRDLLGRDVDIVKNGTLRPETALTANHDKILIYERSN